MSKTIWQPRLSRGAVPMYRGIADAIERDVAAGVLRHGSRLPTHRRLAQLLGVTTLTITRAYGEAARRGLIESTVGKGTFVRAAQRIEERRPLDLSRNIIFGSEDLEIGRELLPELRRWLRSGEYQSPASGSARHKAAGATWMSRSGLTVPTDRVVVFPGAQHALLVMFRTLIEPGGVVMCEPMAYPALRPLLALLRLRVQTIAMDEEGIQPRAFDRACKASGSKVLYCVPTFQNPTAAVMSEARRREIASVAKKHGVILLEDDCYAFLTQVPPIASFLPEQTCYITSTSKSMSPSLRLGFVAAPPSLVPRFEETLYATATFTSTIAAETFTTLLESGEADRVVAKKRELVAHHHRIARRMFGDRMGTTVSPHIWLKLPDEWEAQEFAQQAAVKGVTVAPASLFAIERAPVPNAVRVCLGATPSAAELQGALTTLAEMRPESRIATTAMV